MEIIKFNDFMDGSWKKSREEKEFMLIIYILGGCSLLALPIQIFDFIR